MPCCRVIMSCDVARHFCRRFCRPARGPCRNTEFIAINQDYQATPGDAVAACAGSSDDVWARKLSTGETAVAITNFGDSTADITICFDALGWKGPGARVRDVWKTSDLGTFQGKFTAKAVASHDTVLVKLSPTA